MTDHSADTPASDVLEALLHATGRASVRDALAWIQEGRAITGGINASDLLAALVSAADAGLTGAAPALRTAVRTALNSTLDTSADLILTDTVISPAQYEAALSRVAQNTISGSLADITVSAVMDAQRSDPLVTVSLALVAGLSWRDLQDRASARGVRLPGELDGQWASSQTRTAFEIVDEIVRGTLQPQLPGAVAARPLELLLEGRTGWASVEAMRTGGVSFGTLLAQRDVGSAWSAHRNRTNTEMSKLMIARVLEAFDEQGVNYWSTGGAAPVTKTVMGGHAGARSTPPGQLAAVTKRPDGHPGYAVLVAIARDGGTARKTAATLLKVPVQLGTPVALVLFGTGWAARGESDDLIRAYAGRVFTEHTLNHLAALAADVGPT